MGMNSSGRVKRMLKKLLLGAISLFLLICSVFIGQMVVDRYYTETQSIILVQSDLFKNVSYIKLEDLIKDENIESLFVTEDKIDVGFKVALFYSDLSLKILNKSKQEPNLKRYVPEIYQKTLAKWDDLAVKDKSMLFFKNYYLKVYSETAKN
jgi:hypothetical protein